METPWNSWRNASGSQVSEGREVTCKRGMITHLEWYKMSTSFPVVARVLNMMSGQTREGRLELRASSRVASSRGTLVFKVERDSFLGGGKGEKARWTENLICLQRIQFG